MTCDVGYDAFLLVSFGGPEHPDDVMPFLRRVTGGRGVPPERLAEVAEHYRHFGGVSPINEQCRRLLSAIGVEFAAAGVDLPLYWGNRNWHPLLADTVAAMRADGVRRALAFVTSAYGSYSACRQYLDDIAAARAAVGEGAPRIDKIRQYHDHPGFVEPHADAVRAAYLRLVDDRRRAPDPDDTRLVFTAHSIPLRMAAASGPVGMAAASGPVGMAAASGPVGTAAASGPVGTAAAGGGRYQAQLLETGRLVAAAVAAGPAGAAASERPPWGAQPRWDLVWQSRSGPPQVPWLEPDVNDHLRRLAADGVRNVVVSPIGFVSDHLEVVWDLDEEASATARRLGLGYARAATPGTDPRFVAMVRELVAERLDPSKPRRKLGSIPTWDECRPGCCVIQERTERG